MRLAPSSFVQSRCVSNLPERQTSGKGKIKSPFDTYHIIKYQSQIIFLLFRKSTIPEYKREYEEIEIR